MEHGKKKTKINKNDELTDSVKRQQEFMKQLGYTSEPLKRVFSGSC
ncbi:hypothetical protein MOD91_21355 [Bacillus haynesii]|nr:hypothetical protein [Bacillus haynesii]MCY8669415.1 hypothetical protein [Bacillus haynesii]